MEKIIFITTRVIYPIDNGRKVTLYNYCKGLYEKYNLEVHLFSFINGDESKLKDIPYFIKSAHYAEETNLIEKIKNVLVNSFIKRKWPMQVALFFNKRNLKELEKLVNDIKPDIIMCDMARTAEYVKKLDCNCIKVLDMDDLLSKRYKRQIENIKSGRNQDIVGAYNSKFINSLKKLLSLKMIRVLILKTEYNLMKNYEKDLAKYFEHVIFVSKIEADEYNKMVNKNKAFDVTIGVDYDYFSQEVVEKVDYNLIGFLGNMKYGPNIEAVSYFLEKIFPKLLKVNPNAKFLIIGKCDDSFKEKFAKANIEVTAFVEDIRPFVKKCGLMVAPILTGSGVKTKTLECMAMGKVVITNDIGAEGIRLEEDNGLIMYKNEEEFLEKILYFQNNQQENYKLSLKAQEFIQRYYVWEKIIPNFERIFSK